MSQGSVLDHITEWNQEQCLQNIEETLPKLIDKILESDGSDLTDSLRILCQSLLPVCSIEELESKIFSKIKNKLLEVSGKLYDDLAVIARSTNLSADEMNLELSNHLQTCQDFIQSMDNLVCFVSTHADNLKLSNVQSLLSLVLQILQDSYSHCKESSHIYGEFLNTLAELLSSMFKKAHSLQLNFLSVLDHVVFMSSSDKEMSTLCEIILGLHQLCVIAISLDVKVTVVLWKTISRLACQYKEALLNKLDVDKILLTLTEDMQASVDYHIQLITASGQPDEKLFTRTIKVLGFQMKVLVAIVKEYESALDVSIHGILKLMLTIQSVQPPSLISRSLNQEQLTAIQKQLGLALEPLISYFIPNFTFIMTINRIKKDIDFNQWSAYCIILVTIIKLLPNYSDDTQTAWINPRLYPEDEIRPSILKAIFDTLPHCYVSLCLPACLPNIMCNGQPQRNVSLHHHLCCHLCVFIACLPAKHFSVVEDCLLENVFHSNTHNFLLATDVWCFVARYGTADLCRDHCILLAKLLQRFGRTDFVQHSHLVNVLRRLLKFLAPEHLDKFTSEVPIEDNLPVYGVFPFHIFTDAQLQGLTGRLVALCVQTLNKWMESSSRKISDACRLNDVYRVLCNLYGSRPVHDASGTEYTSLVDYSVKCMMSLPCTATSPHKHVQYAAAGVLEFLAYNSKHLDNTTLYKVLSVINGWLRYDELEPVVKVNTAYFLSSLSTKVFPPDIQQVNILRIIPKIFSCLLADGNPIVRQVSIENFTQFAEETVHETIVPESLQYNEDTESLVVSYLSELSSGRPPVQTDSIDLVKYQRILVQQFNDPSPLTSPIDQPPNKKCKVQDSDTELDRQFQEAVKLLEDGTRQLEAAYSENGSLPSVCAAAARRIRDKLAQLLTNCT